MSIVVDDIRSNLLQLDMFEKAERLRVFKDYMFYKGESSNLKAAKENPALYGQNWPVADKLDYEPTQDVRNITKKLLRKQARFMFSVPPNITLKPLKIPDMQACEDLQNHISQIFEDNNFWNATKNAFLSSTIKKRVLARIEANPGSSIVIKYEDIENFNYKEKNNKLMWVRFFQEDDNNALTDDDTKKIYYTHTYWYRVNDNKTIDVMYQKDTYSDGEYTIPHESQEQVTGFSTIPCWLIKHNEELNSTYGYSDVEDLRGMQSQYNKKNSDFADALRFQMFGSTAIIDGNPDDVSKLNIRPNALHAIRTSEEAMEKDKQASIARQEYNMSNAEAVNKYLDRLGDDMRDTLDMPKLSDLVNIPSAKAIRYLYNDLISRCMDRWSSWRPVIKQIILFIIHASSILKYPDFQSSWSNLTFNINIKPKYPLPDDEDTAKQTAIQEVTAHVRTVASYLKEYGNVEDTKSAFNQILQEIADITNAEGGSLQLGDGNGDSNEGGGDE